MASVGHPELVVTDETPEFIARVFDELAPQVLAGRTVEPGNTFELAEAGLTLPWRQTSVAVQAAGSRRKKPASTS